jgi:dolichol-phosphate mannosyltransferase
MKKSLVVIPTYNESENVAAVLTKVLGLNLEGLDILIVDDNSPDGTADIVKDLMKQNNRIFIIERSGKLGLGTAYIEGFRYALQHGYDFIFEMDADLSHNPNEIPNMLEEIKEADLIIGSRYITGVNVINWPLSRLFLSVMASKYTRIITGMPIHDCTGGFKCFRREVLETVPLDAIHSNGYSFQIEMNFRTWKRNFRIKEIPIIFYDRTVGKSKMTRKIMVEAAFVVWRLKIASLFGSY